MALRFLSYKGLVSSDLLDDKALLNCLKKTQTMRERTRTGTEVNKCSMSHLGANLGSGCSALGFWELGTGSKLCLPD